MNPARLLVLFVTLPLLLGGCGEKDEVTDEIKPKLKSVNYGELEQRESIYYLKGSNTPYTGKVFLFDESYGHKLVEGNYKDGKPDGLTIIWHDNGQKRAELNIKDGKQISKKWWNSKGEPVDSQKEAY